MTGGERYVTDPDARGAIKGRETEILDALGIPWREGKPHINCPYPGHADNNPSWRWDRRKARAYCTCHTGGHSPLDVIMNVEGSDFEAAKVRAAELLEQKHLIRERRRKKRTGGGGVITPEQRCNGTTPNTGCTLAAYAEAKRLPIEFLRSISLSQISYQGSPAIRIPYLGIDRDYAAARFRIALYGEKRFVWKSGSKARLYGLERLGDVLKAGYVVIVEGESDCHTLWLHDFPALGLPGNTNWNEARDAPLVADIPVIYIVVEPGQSGEGVLNWLSRSAIASRARLLRLPLKDPSAIHVHDPDGFTAAFRRALDEAEPYQAIAYREAEAEATRAKGAAGDLILEIDVLSRFGAEVERAGLVGEAKNAKVLFLALTTRVFDRPVSVAVKGPSSGGKSYTVEVVLRFFPCSAYWERTALSDRALAYSDEDFRHRHLVIYEPAGMSSEIASYLIRSLLSEGRIRYELVEKTKDGMKPRTITKDGPTGLIVTTTAARLHPENETRLLSLTVKDTPQQTAVIFRALARGEETTGAVDYARWRAFQNWLETGERRVVVPFAAKLAELVPPVAVRLRRDFKLLLTLIHAHALLHRERRERDNQGRILATLDDYAAVRELVADLFAESVDATVKPETRETVAAVKALRKDEVSVTEISKALRLDKGAASRRVADAVSRGYLANNETRRGRPARITLGDVMPGEIEILLHPDRLADCCSVAVASEGIETPSPPAISDAAAELAEIEI